MNSNDVISLEQEIVNKLVYKAPIKEMPSRTITEYWSLDGKLLHRIDPLDKFKSIIDDRFGS